MGPVFASGINLGFHTFIVSNSYQLERRYVQVNQEVNVNLALSMAPQKVTKIAFR
jgi:hypothetical protein